LTEPEKPQFVSLQAHHESDPFRLLVESVVDYAIYLVDPAGRIASWNPGAQRIYQFTAEEIVGQPFASVYTAEDAAAGKPEESRQKTLDEGHYEFETLRVRKDGSQFWAHMSASSLTDYLGNHAGFCVITRDITERKRAEETVRQERDFSDTILSSLPGVYYMYDSHGRFLRWNQRFEEVTGYTTGEIAKLHPLDLFAGRDKTLLAERIAAVFENGTDDVEAELVSKDGRRTPYYFNGVRAEFNGQQYLLGMGIDISEPKRAQKELRATDTRLQQAAKAAQIGLWDLDLKTNKVFYSAEWKSQVGCDESEIGDQLDEWVSRLHLDDKEAALARMDAAWLNPDRVYESEFRLRHKDGTYRRIRSHAAIVVDEDGVPARMLGSHVDITEQFRAEQHQRQSQKMEAVGQLAAGVAHDFNNLLTVINGYSDLLLDQMEEEDPKHPFVSEIRSAGTRARELTRQLLAFSRQQVLELQVLELNTVVLDTEKLLRRVIGETVHLVTSLTPGLGRVQADPGQLEQVLVNLAVNARDAMPAGGTLTLETRNVTLDASAAQANPEAEAGNYVVLSVRDTGSGMDEQTLSKIFEPFFTTKRANKGTGLGLATVHGIVKQSHGFIEVQSEMGRGTAFHVYLPESHGALTQLRQEAAAGAMPSGSETILLVEDEDTVRALELRVLERCGYRVLVAANGREAIALADAHVGRIDLLLTDVVMPEVGGLELALEFARTRQGCKILFLSGYTDGTEIDSDLPGVALGFLQKPFTPSELAQKVRSFLDSND